jgi:hypothetical protein
VAVVVAVAFMPQAHLGQAVQAVVAQVALQVHLLLLAQREPKTQVAVAVVLDTLKDQT